MLEISSEIELSISDLNVDGSAVARFCPPNLPDSPDLRKQVVFVDQGLPGERLLARIISRKKQLYFAQKIRCLSRSPQYAEPFCPYFGSCGGCAFQNLHYSAQLVFKQQRVVQTLARIGGIKLEIPEILPAPALSGYRNKMEYAFGSSAVSANPVLGFRRRGGQEILDIERCPLQSRESALVLQAVRDWAASGHLTAWEDGRGALRYLVLREPEYCLRGLQRSVELICGDSLPDAKNMDALWSILAELGVTSLLFTRRLSKYNVAQGEGRVKSYGQPTLWESFGSLLLEYPISSFAQTNTKAAAALYAQAAEFAGLTGGETLWDIYSGAGALALYLGGKGKSVWGVEQDRQAVKAAVANAARLQFRHCIFEAGDAGLLLKQKNETPDIIVVDPPRAGLSGAVRAGIKKAAPRKIIYLSCDPATLARDLSELARPSDTVYRLDKLVLADLFPHTPHVEVIALLSR
ncbi:MAG: 23S rRNA (uracil(1939)-C(5))-methyltransferase RlmD [Deltaproteobacteria bacterium]|nr:23S rRNA (uracil(1939)-C(5))-methyltransferase RlmD [Deltaproteobacteria bacterium]